MLLKKKEKDKRHHDLFAGLREWPTQLGLHPELATIVDRRSTSAENAQKGDSTGDSSGPHQDPALSAKVTTGGLSASISRWRRGATSYGLMGPGASCPDSNVEEPWVTITVEKRKVIFFLDSGAHFSVLLFSPGPQSNNKVILRGIFD
jgi:hypothetical protein